MISYSISFGIHTVIISIVSSNIGSNIVLNSGVQLEAVLHTEGYFADTALKATLFSWPLPFISCPFGQESKPYMPRWCWTSSKCPVFSLGSDLPLQDGLSLWLTLHGLLEWENGRCQNSWLAPSQAPFERSFAAQVTGFFACRGCKHSGCLKKTGGKTLSPTISWCVTLSKNRPPSDNICQLPPWTYCSHE